MIPGAGRETCFAQVTDLPASSVPTWRNAVNTTNSRSHSCSTTSIDAKCLYCRSRSSWDATRASRSPFHVAKRACKSWSIGVPCCLKPSVFTAHLIMKRVRAYGHMSKHMLKAPHHFCVRDTVVPHGPRTATCCKQGPQGPTPESL